MNPEPRPVAALPKKNPMLITDERRHLYRVLESLSLPAEAGERLAALGITTLDELRDHWTYGNRELINRYIGESPLRLVSAPPAAMLATRSAGGGPSPVVNLFDAGRVRPLVNHARGVLLTPAQQQTAATAPVRLPSATRRAAAPRKGVSLVKKFPAVRDQKTRGTCVAFASVAYLEFHLSEQAGAKVARHAEQFVYWACKVTDGMPDREGTFVSTARDVLKKRGACLHKTWKYNPLPVPNNESQAPPPSGAEDEAKQATWKRARSVAGKDSVAIRGMLDERRPVVLSVKTFPSWDYPTTADTGEIAMPFPGEDADGGHAICVVGYEVNPNIPGGGAFILRNSWGSSWAKPQGRFGAGYGTLYFDYVAKYGLEAFA